MDLRSVIAEIEKEPGMTERLKEAMRVVRSRGSSQARVDEHHLCFNKTISRMINNASKQDWLPLVTEVMKPMFDHLRTKKKVLSKFPPSHDECACDICACAVFIQDRDAGVAGFKVVIDEMLKLEEEAGTEMMIKIDDLKKIASCNSRSELRKFLRPK